MYSKHVMRRASRIHSRPQSIALSFSTSRPHNSYEDTIPNLKIGSQTRVVFQGFTGKQATFDAKQSIEYGTKVVGGVRPGYTGEHLGLPVLPSMRAVMEQLKPDATAVYVAAPHAAAAIEEAIEAEVPLIVAVAEHIPLHDSLRVQAILRSQSKSRLVGANCPGMINAHARCRIGFPPIPFFTPGSVAIVAKSGTLSYETVASTTRAGVGQSLVIGMGGDVLPGTDFVDALTVFEHDQDTQGIIIVGEVGGFAEERAAEWIEDYHRRVKNPKPIMALVAGLQAVSGRVMGHAGAFAAPGEGDAKSKIRAFEKTGVTMVYHPSKFGDGMKQLLARRGVPPHSTVSPPGGQKRSLHTLVRRRAITPRSIPSSAHRRSLHLDQHHSFEILERYGIPTVRSSRPSVDATSISVYIDRASMQPCISIKDTRASQDISTVPFSILDTSEDVQTNIKSALSSASSRIPTPILENLCTTLINIFRDKEAVRLEILVSPANSENESQERSWVVESANFQFDDAAYRSSKRQEDVHKLRNLEIEVKEEVEAEKEGIVYIRLPGSGKVGALVNGAGLAMNTTDAIAKLSGPCANFLDTGGKATSATVAASFKLILSDPRVTAIFVNIFGGLTKCDMIAEGVLLAYKDLKIQLPVVVRLRGTNEKEGQKMIADSGLELWAYDDFEEAARKVIELSEKAR